MKTIVGFYALPDDYRDRILMWSEVGRLLGRFEVMTGRHARDEALLQAQSKSFALCPISDQVFHNVRLHLAAYRALYHRCRAGDVDLLHGTLGFWTLPYWLNGRSIEGIPKLASYFDSAYDLPVMWSPWPGLRKGITDLRMFFQSCVESHCADGCTVFGEGHREPLSKAYSIPISRVYSVPNCVDGAMFYPRSRSAAHRRPRAFFCAGLTAQKGLPELLKALQHPELQNLELWLAGAFKAHDEAEMKRALLPLGDRVRVLGKLQRHRLPEVMAEVDFMVHPSHQEGSPRAVIEAMACGLPAVLRALPGTLDLDRQNCWAHFVDSGASDRWVEALSRMLDAGEKEWRARGAAARAVYLSRHCCKSAALEWAQMYQRFLK